MAERNSLLNCRTGNGTAGSNPALSASKTAIRTSESGFSVKVHSIPKVGFSRRLLGIPNPYHQSILAKSIADKWTKIEAIFNKSTITNSKPIQDTTGNRALKSIKTFGEFKKECLINSFDKLFEVKTDVSCGPKYMDQAEFLGGIPKIS